MSLIRQSLPTSLLPGCALLAAITPGAVQQAIAALLGRIPGLSSTEALVLSLSSRDRLRTALGALVVFNVVRWLNRILNGLATNSWRLAAPADWDWPNELAVITGGASGIGQATAEKLLAKGLRVAILDVQDITGSTLKEHPRARFYKCDLTKSAEVAAAADAIRKELGNPSVLINNAGICRPCKILDMTEEQLHATFNINTISHWFTVQQFLPWMIQQNKGHVITIASGASFLSVPKGSDYAGSKSSARAFHETLGTELKYFYKAPKVLTTSVHPEFVRTPIIKDFEAHLDQEGTLILNPDVVADKIVARILSRRGGTLVLPENHSIVTGFRGWPGWMQEIVRDKMGARSARRKE
ncbi:unnamed protein product [Clonostachys rosea f. rosea IK726]|uniref:Uncharacterized protein n=1 Tax=Clonostachys rosea f. rosea IK726 TaxID=1349383 RepID=A0ACA9UQ39_BIOOC|nr:unnamed protein product [Clonostachys rosea f. rosea IK726]